MEIFENKILSNSSGPFSKPPQKSQLPNVVEKTTNFALKCFCFFWSGVLYSQLNMRSYFDEMGFNYFPLLSNAEYEYARTMCEFEAALPDTGGLGRILINRTLFKNLPLFCLFQEGLLRKVPEKILRKYSPAVVHLVNHKMAKISRVVLTATVFSLSHSMTFKNPNYRLPLLKRNFLTTSQLISSFIVGLLLGSIQEVTKNPIFVLAMDSGLNALRASEIYRDGLIPVCLSKRLF